jgi:guanylate kinase
MLFVISAPSGTGKTTVIREILKDMPDLVFSVSATTRKKRQNEIEGEDYFFFTEEEFLKRIKDGDLIEFEKLYNGTYYGTLRSFVDKNLKENKNIIFEVDVKGALSIKKAFKENVIMIFLMPPDTETLRNRLKNRSTESEKQIDERLKRVEFEMGNACHFDYTVLNVDLEKAVKEVKKIINQYKQ